MRTTLNLDDRLMAELRKATRARTKTEAIHIAAREFLRRRAAARVKELAGKIPLVDNWKELRDLERYEV